MSRRLRAGALTVSALGVVYLGPLGFPAATPLASAEPDCRPYVLGIGGTGQRAAEQAGQPTMLGDHLAAYGDGYRTESLDYPSSIWPTGPYTKDESVRDGQAAATAKIDAYRAECPNGNVTVLGHSLGAEVAGNIQDQADHTILYGDPRAEGGIYDALPGIVPGISSPGERELGPNTVSVCHEYDVVCDAPAPWVDPVHFGLAVQGYLTGWHGYAPGEADGLESGQHLVDMPSPNPALPEHTPTGLPPIEETLPLPEWMPGPLPSLADFDDMAAAWAPSPVYTPTPVREFVPDFVESALPPEIADFVPPPLPDLGIRLP
ncbi:cutinase family protein [Nocardia otitidiscaviarum]|uniref:cutinase family protein n=1 Tax=Nocardia otitidiscaviarum TaxID=1823 RepID=UPI002453B678|nr:PE-PPE domain-containing protein [Nocardia otitidiscaviarum]